MCHSCVKPTHCNRRYKDAILVRLADFLLGPDDLCTLGTISWCFIPMRNFYRMQKKESLARNDCTP